MILREPELFIDFYKSGHIYQYPKGTELVFSNYTCRGSRLQDVQDGTIFFGLQYFMQNYLVDQLSENFFKASREEVVKRYKRRMDSSLGPGAVNTHHIEALHELGFVPLCIMALPEGSLVPLRVPSLVLYNTLPEFYWLTNYIETILSSSIWMGINSATIAREYRKILNAGAVKTGGDPGFVPWQGHDFSFRGMPGIEAAALSGAAHLLFFTGTDTIPAIELIERFYNPSSDTLIGGSVAATEHAVMCMHGQVDEKELFKHLLTNVYPSGIVSVVSDTWDLWKVLTEYLPELKSVIEAREGKLVIRPDSGDPVKILCGDPDSAVEHIRKGVVELLWDTFGGTINEKGYKVLNPKIGTIYGDSITLFRARQILLWLEQKGFASTNVVFGIGSYTYQYNTRDTFGQAVKATYGEVNGQPRAIFKNPITDDGVKKSAKGMLAVNRSDNSFVLKEEATEEELANSALQVVFFNGIRPGETFETIRTRALSTLI